jgi:hypothetical protein
MRIIIHSEGANTPLPLIEGKPDFSDVSGRSLEILEQNWKLGNYSLQEMITSEVLNPPLPIAFYEKMIGVTGACPLNDVYNSISAIALNPNSETSALNYATSLFKGALDNDWSKSYAKTAFASAYGILKGFLTTEQIEIVDSAITEFNLG